jgi:hypothetical protein
MLPQCLSQTLNCSQSSLRDLSPRNWRSGAASDGGQRTLRRWALGQRHPAPVETRSLERRYFAVPEEQQPDRSRGGRTVPLPLSHRQCILSPNLPIPASCPSDIPHPCIHSTCLPRTAPSQVHYNVIAFAHRLPRLSMRLNPHPPAARPTQPSRRNRSSRHTSHRLLPFVPWSIWSCDTTSTPWASSRPPPATRLPVMPECTPRASKT